MESIHRNLTHQLVHELGKAILQGKYPIESNLPSEAALCAQFDMSRTATREAVKMLTGKGLISSRPRKGIKVLPLKHWNLFDIDVLNWILIGKPDLKMLRHFLQLRLALEPQAAYLAAQFAQEQDLINIETALQKMKTAEQEFGFHSANTHEADIEFHKSILLASNNPFFMQLENFIATALKINLRFTNRVSPVTNIEYQTHKDLFDCIKNKQAQAASDVAMETQKATLKIVNQQIEQLTS